MHFLDRPTAAVEAMLARVIAWPILRLSLGRWPTRVEAQRFRQAFCDRPARLPALLRGLGSIPTIRNHFIDLLAAPVCGLPPLLFLHIEKTAGTSVIDYLAAHFPPDAVDPDPFHGAPGHLLSPLPRDKDRYDFIWGHQDLPALLRCQPPKRLVLTFLREPRARILSLYTYWRALRPEEIARNPQHDGVIAARSRGLLAFLESPEAEVRDFIDNIYARRLTGRYVSHGAPDDDAAMRAAAMSALELIDVIGITEHMGASLLVLAARIGAAPPPIVPRHNVLGTMQMDPEGLFAGGGRIRPGRRERACLDSLTRLDRDIYAAALQRFRRTTSGK